MVIILTNCYTVLTRPKQVETAVQATVAILGFQFGLYHAVVTLIYVSNQPRIIVISTLVSECAKCLTDQPRMPGRSEFRPAT